MGQHLSLFMLLFYWSGTSLYLFKRWRLYGGLLAAGGLIGYFLLFDYTSHLLIPIILLFLAVFLAMIELFIPGFGVFGLASIIILSIAIAIGQFELIGPALEMAATFSVGSLLFIFLKLKGYEIDLGRQFVLQTTLNKESGFLSSQSKENLKGLQGVTKTPLRPTGKILIENYDELIDVESERGMIGSNVSVKVSRVKGNVVYVIPVDIN